MTNVPARPFQPIPRDEVVAAGYIARYRDPTRAGKQIHLRQWFEWCAQHDIAPLDAERAHIEVYARWLEEAKKYAPATCAQKLGTVAGFYHFARIDGYIATDPTEHVRRPKVQRLSSKQALTRAELLQCLDIADAAHPQDHALWCLLALNGVRIGEALSRDVEHLGRLGGYRTISIEREKGNPPADLPLSPRTSWAFDRHLGNRTAGPLFLHLHGQARGERLDSKGANRIVKRVVKAAGIDKTITCHSLRHTHITLALNAGVSVRDVSNSMGYADARMVSYYDRDKDSLPRHSTHMVSAFVEGS